MNHCESYEPLLDAFTEGDLFMEDLVWVQQHLNSCPDCQAYVEDLLAIRAAFPTVDETEVPAGFTASVMAAVAATPQATASAAGAAPAPQSAKKRTPWTRVLSGLAACCAIVLLAQGGVKMGRGGSMAPQAEEAAAPMEMCTADAITEAAVEEEAPAGEAKMAAPQPEPAPESEVIHDGTLFEYAAGSADGAPSPYRIIVTVDAHYIADALDDRLPLVEYDEIPEAGKPPVHTREYELTMAEYDALVAQLAEIRDEAPAEEGFSTNSDRVLVIVRE